MPVKSLRARQAEATRELLISTARDLFAAKGYADTSIEEIIHGAGVARGALYHHFNGKEALFRAVYDGVQSDALGRIVSTALAQPEPWEAVRAGLTAFLDVCLEPPFRRIVILDSVSVFQWQAWDQRIEHGELPMLRTILAPLKDNQVLPGVGLEPLAFVTLGGLYGAALYIAVSSNPKRARKEAEGVIDILIAGVRAASASSSGGP